MAAKEFTKKELNFFKFAFTVLEEFPKALRQTFVSLWDTKIAVLPGYQPWDDSPSVRNMFFTSEGGRTDVPTNRSIQEWDCTALFKATIYAKTFESPSTKKTLGDLYLKARPKPSPFYPTVVSPTGNPDETLTLAVDQLRLLRNTLCHSAEPRMNKATLDQYIQLTKEAFTELNAPTATIDDIGNLTESNFPTEKFRKLKESIPRELESIKQILEDDVSVKISDIDENINFLVDHVKDIKIMLQDKNKIATSV